MIASDNVTAVLLNWRRPDGIQQCVDSIRAGGIHNIWVWCQENAEPPDGATAVFRSSLNTFCYTRVALGTIVPTDWVLLCDDDLTLTIEGIQALLKYADPEARDIYCVHGMWFQSPLAPDRDSTSVYSHVIHGPTEVDLMGNRGKLVHRDTLREIYGVPGVWDVAREAIGDMGDDDLCLSVAAKLSGKARQIVVPTTEKAFTELPDSEGPNALRWRENITAQRVALCKRWQAAGWETLGRLAGRDSAEWRTKSKRRTKGKAVVSRKTTVRVRVTKE